jgi:hypothetical protein
MNSLFALTGRLNSTSLDANLLNGTVVQTDAVESLLRLVLTSQYRLWVWVSCSESESESGE